MECAATCWAVVPNRAKIIVDFIFGLFFGQCTMHQGQHNKEQFAQDRPDSAYYISHEACMAYIY